MSNKEEYFLGCPHSPRQSLVDLEIMTLIKQRLLILMMVGDLGVKS